MSEPDSNVTLRQRIGRFALTLVWWLEYDRSRHAVTQVSDVAERDGFG